MAGRALVLLALLGFGCSEPAASTPQVYEAGDGPVLRVPELGPVPGVPAFTDDPASPAKTKLGTLLFFDPRLSGSGHTSCDACHLPSTVFQDNLPLSTPDRSYPDDSPTLSRNTLSMMNLVYASVFRWDGSSTDLVDVLAFPLAEPNMNVARLPRGSTAVPVPAAQSALHDKLTEELTGYLPLYEEAFGVDPKTQSPSELWRLTGRALRAFVTVAVSRDSAFDRWNAGDDAAMSAPAQRGLGVFRGKGRCVMCHSGPLFTDLSFHNVSTSPPGPDGKRPDEGRYDVTHDERDRGAFLTPTLRQAYDTAPYFHDGSRPGLIAVFEHFASSEVTLDPNHDAVFDTPLELTASDISDLLAFVEALRGAPIRPPPRPTEFP